MSETDGKGKTKKLTPKQERFAAEISKNGGNATRAAIASGYAESSAHVRASELVRNSNIQERIQRARERAGITPEIVTGVLAQQLLGDIGDLLDDEGRFNYKLAKRRGVTSQIQKFRQRERDITEDGVKVGSEVISEIELYSAQHAAKILAGTLGMNKESAVNPQDAARARAEVDRLVAEGWTEQDARDIVVEAEPRASQWLH